MFFRFFLNFVWHNIFNPKEMKYCLIPFQFPHAPILYPLKKMFSRGIKLKHSEKMSLKQDVTTNLFEHV